MPNKPQRYVLLPPRGLTSDSVPGNLHVNTFMASLQPQSAMHGIPAAHMKVIDSAHENGIKLVEMTPDGITALRQRAPGVRIVPEVFYKVARLPLPRIEAGVAKKKAAAKPAATTTITITAEGTGAPIAGATVVAFTDYKQGIGAQGKTKKNGSIALALGGAQKLQRLYIYPQQGFWPMLKKNVALTGAAGKAFALHPIDLKAPDVLQHYRTHMPGGDGAGVVVGIVDTGSGPHQDVPMAGGQNTVVGENAADWQDNGDPHGTHVAGTVGARGHAAGRMSGYAPKATLRAYRVFGKGKDGASNYSIAKAIDAAVADGCDIINMSLGGQGAADPATASAIADARAAGTVVVCASGNDGLHSVGQPAADPRAIAVGAFGRKGTYPADSASADDAGKASTKSKQLFMADFSNWGMPIDFAGTGVAVVSTVPGDAWAVMNGTSMASPSVAGVMARLLSANAAVMNMPRNQARSDAILQLAYQHAKPLGFGAEWEGNGWF